MKLALALCAILSLPIMVFSAEYNLGELAKSEKVEIFNRSLDQTKAVTPEVVYLNAAANDGLAWITDSEFSEGTIELEIKGTNLRGKSFVGCAFHGNDNQSFDAVYFRPFNFQAKNSDKSIQYISMPNFNWKKLRDLFPGKFEGPIEPKPEPEDWVKLKLVIKEKNVTAYVNGSDDPALQVALLQNRLKGKVGLWVGNNSDGWFRNLKIIPSP